MLNPAVNNGSIKKFRRIGILVGSSVFLLFLLGSLVRATGSGMGCPDWPKCFGQLAPPTNAADLPENYEEIFLKKRVAKLERFTNTLEKVGMGKRAEAIRKDPKMYEPESFDPLKAWIEYINRLFGVLSGFLALIMGFWVFRFKELRLARVWFLFGFLFLILNAWLGSVVVTTNLLPGIVSLHFLLAFLCLFGFLNSVHRVSPLLKYSEFVHRDFRWWWIWVWITVILGTWSREQIESLKLTQSLVGDDGILNVQSMGITFAIHRYSPLLMLIFLSFRWWRLPNNSIERTYYMVLFLMVFSQVLLGAIQIQFVLPVWTQIAHVLLGSAVLTYSYLLYLSTKRTT
jgi:cytochrome c oxidase assembly protein subunit 15